MDSVAIILAKAVHVQNGDGMHSQTHVQVADRTTGQVRSHARKDNERHILNWSTGRACRYDGAQMVQVVQNVLAHGLGRDRADDILHDTPEY